MLSVRGTNLCAADYNSERHVPGATRARNKGNCHAEAAPAESAIGRCELGRAYEAIGNLAQARTEMEVCVRLDPSPQNHYRLGLVYQKLGLKNLAGNEMERRKQMLRKMSEETALGLNALESLDLTAR